MPLGATYVELVAVVDEAEAAASGFGRWVASAQRPGGPLGWAVRTDALDRVAERLRLPVRHGSRTAPDGGLLCWRSAGIDQAAAEPCLPFFIEWGPGTPLPGRAAAKHRAGDVSIARLELAGDANRLAAWLDGHPLPVAVRPGTCAVARIILQGAAGAIVL